MTKKKAASDALAEVCTRDAEKLPADELRVGDWYWMRIGRDPDAVYEGKPKNVALVCLTGIGSNYAEVRHAAAHRVERVHFDVFHEQLTPEPDAEAVLAREVAKCQREAKALMGEIVALTARLGMQPTAELGKGDGQEAALVLADGQRDYGTYKAELALAKDKTLPDLFKQIKGQHEWIKRWMEATLIPSTVEVGKLEQVRERISDRIFTVDLYAGLSEQTVQFADGEPAAMTERVRLLQRLCFMDEECLARYEAGGMEFEDIEQFEAWLARPENRDRLMPFPRCVVSFRVRRNEKLREITDLVSLWRAIRGIDGEEDMYTFLFVRNGERLYRIYVPVDLGPSLFPDMDAQRVGNGKLWGEVDSFSAKKKKKVVRVVSDEQHQGDISDYQRLDPDMRWARADPRASRHPYEPGNLYYDDISAFLAEEAKRHNRIAMILQGLLDRSRVFEPHPPWKIWSPEGFAQALELVYDKSRALVAGERPDFEAYRRRLNANVTVGSIMTGQQQVWRNTTYSESSTVEQWRTAGKKKRAPGDGGPGTIAPLASYSPRTGRCVFRYKREVLGLDGYKQYDALFECKIDDLLHVESYQKGDYRIFFDDPRTREEYLQWAPLLLEGEEFVAGNRTPTPPGAKQKRGVGTPQDRRRRERDKLIKSMLGQIVISTREIRTRGGTVYPPGTLFKVSSKHRGEVNVLLSRRRGAPPPDKPGVGYVRGVDPYRDVRLATAAERALVEPESEESEDLDTDEQPAQESEQ